MVRCERGGAFALIEGRGSAPAPRAHAGAEGRWTLAPMAALRRRGHQAMLEAPFTGVRVRCLDTAASAFLGRCAIGAGAERAPERTLAGYAAGAGLVERCAHAGPPARADGDPNTCWSPEEGALWELHALADASEGGRGALWPGTRYAPLEPLEAGVPEGTGIALEGGARLARAVPGSARAFAGTYVGKRALGRWLARFARIRTRAEYETDGHRYESVVRGMPEGGGLGTLRVWLALERVRGVERGLYAYDALGHRLHPVAAEIGAITRQAETSMRGIEGAPAGVAILSTRAARLGAKYHRIALAIALQNAGACLAAATSAGAHEGIAVRGNGAIAGDAWLETTGHDPRLEAPVGAFAFGHEA